MTRFRIPRLLPAAALALAFTISACDTATDDEYVAGVNVTQLFAQPNADELTVIQAEWAGRALALAPQNVTVVKDFAYTAAASASGPFIPYTVRIVRHTVPVPATQGGGTATHYGAIMVPAGLTGTASAAVMVYNHGGDNGTSIAEAGFFAAALTPTIGTAKKPIIWVVPSFRAEKLRWAPNGVPGGTLTAADSVTSTGPDSPWDYDVDDALSLVNVALAQYPQADASKIGVMGVSRGGAVALLMGIRDPRVKRVLDMFGPTDFLGDYVKNVAIKGLNGEAVDLPGFDVLNASLLQPLKAGQLSIPQVRNQIIRRSPAYFASALTEPVQIQHGDADPTVLVSQADRLAQVLGATAQTSFTGTVPTPYSFYRWVGGVHSPSSFPAAQWVGAAQTFIAAL
ncbi:MAG: acetylxylan esterase [Bacteroidetes bacterium]|nr:acetylxylan esterase [Bacteroidota bacterium]